MPLISGNTGNLGLPLCLFAFGDAGFGYAIIVFAVTSILAFTIGIWVVSGGFTQANTEGASCGEYNFWTHFYVARLGNTNIFD